MKRILIVTNLILLVSIIYFNGCKQDEEKMPALPCPECKNYSDSGFNGLSVNAAAQLSGLYAANHYPNYTINGALTDSKSIWFSLDSIKKFIFKIEEAMCKCGVNHDLGVRIYFGEYPDASSMANNAEFNTLDPVMAQRHTLFMVPTYNYAGADYDFDPWHLGKGGCEKPTTICEWVNADDSTFLSGNMLALSPDQSRGIKNHGNMCPPLCPEGSSCFPTVIPLGKLKSTEVKSGKK